MSAESPVNDGKQVDSGSLSRGYGSASPTAPRVLREAQD